MTKVTFWTSSATNDGAAVVVYFDNGECKTADNTRATFATIMHALDTTGQVDINLFDALPAVSNTLRRVSDRITVGGRELLFDGDPVHSTLAEAIMQALRNDEDYSPLALFMENLAENPNEHSREMTYDWLASQQKEGGFTIDADGYLLGYKGVARDGDSFKSINSGTAWVNDVQQTGQIRQGIGDVVSMARSSVQHDPSNGCSVGLHVGTWSYASSWGHGVVLQVRIHPRDIVSVPTDSSAQKMRVAKYEVVRVLDAPVSRLVDDWETDEDDEWDEDDF